MHFNISNVVFPAHWKLYDKTNMRKSFPLFFLIHFSSVSYNHCHATQAALTTKWCCLFKEVCNTNKNIKHCALPLLSFAARQKLIRRKSNNENDTRECMPWERHEIICTWELLPVVRFSHYLSFPFIASCFALNNTHPSGDTVCNTFAVHT